MARPSLRDDIVAAALEQFHTHGFNAAGVKDITGAAGAPKGSFYSHFESKEALAILVLQRYGSTRRLAELTDESADPVRRLREHFEFLRDETLGYGFTRGCLIGNFGAEVSDHSEPLRTAVRDAYHVWTEAIATAIGQAQRAGSVPAGLDPGTTARFVVSAWEGTLIQARAERSTEDFEAFFTLVFGSLLGTFGGTEGAEHPYRLPCT